MVAQPEDVADVRPGAHERMEHEIVAHSTVEKSAVSHPLLDSGRRVSADVRVNRVEHIVVLEPPGTDVFLRQHVDEVLVVHQREVGTAALQHVDVSPGLPEIRADAGQERASRFPRHRGVGKEISF